MQRGNNRQSIFFGSDDYRSFLEYLAKGADEHGCTVHAYVLMTNHVHLLMSASRRDSIARTMQSLGRGYVARINRRHQRTGTLWEGRYKASLVDTEDYLLACYRYIELNPVRAGMAAHPDQYRWSSYEYHARGVPNALLVPHPVYTNLGTSPEARQRAYREFVRKPTDEEEMSAIRAAVSHCLAVGSEPFKNRMEELLGRRMRPGRAGRPPKENKGQSENAR